MFRAVKPGHLRANRWSSLPKPTGTETLDLLFPSYKQQYLVLDPLALRMLCIHVARVKIRSREQSCCAPAQSCQVSGPLFGEHPLHPPTCCLLKELSDKGGCALLYQSIRTRKSPPELRAVTVCDFLDLKCIWFAHPNSFLSRAQNKKIKINLCQVCHRSGLLAA